MLDPAVDEFLAQYSPFRRLLDESPLMLLLLDSRGRCVFSSRARLAFYGRTATGELGSGWTEAIHADDRGSVLDELLAAVRERRPYARLHRARRADGALRRISMQALPWVAPDGRYVAHMAIGVDVTDQQQFDPGGREEPRQLRRLIENAHDMVYRVRLVPTYSLDYVGGAVTAITGRTAAEFYADPGLTTRCVHPNDRRHLIVSPRDPVEAQSTVILRCVHPDGRVVHAEHRRVPVYNDAGTLIAVEGIARDVTEFVEAQQRLRESEEQLRQLAARLQDAREAERAQVARELHDELGQTLTALKLDIGRMADALPPGQRSLAVTDRLQSLIGLSDIGIATVKRIATKLRPPTLDHLGLAEAIRWEALTFKARTGLRCTVRTNRAQTRLSAEQQTALFRIFQEAITNVARHAHASAVQVTLFEQGKRFEMRIRDNGRGISEAELADPAAIGLVGMRERTALVGGSFRISGRRGKGTTVCIEVPVSQRTATRLRSARVGR
jgi:PAS domain S-box-containing protein